MDDSTYWAIDLNLFTKMKYTIKANRGFTLVELLVVIAIIASLAALSAPVILKAKEKAKRVSATNACNAIEVAVDQFENDNNFLPYEGDSPSTDNGTGYRSDQEIMNVLTGKEDLVNFKEKIYFTFNDAKGGPGNYFDGLNVTDSKAELYDPWGNPYLLFFDYDLDGEITNPEDPRKNVNGKNVAVYTKGADQKSGNKEQNKDNASNF